MHSRSFRVVALTTILLASGARLPAQQPNVDWPSFRGIAASGVAEGRPAPTTFAPADAVWKTSIPGLGHSSPVIWGHRLCVTTAISGRKDAGVKTGAYGDIASVNDDTPHEWKVLCLDKRTGAVLWERTVHRGVPAVKRHTKSTHANSTLATDGTHLAAMFGSEGLHVYDLDGTLRWTKSFGLLDSGFFMAPDAQWEFASSPVIHDGRLLILADVQKNSFLAAFDVKTGKELWRTPRADVPTWSTPAVVDVNGRRQVVVNGWKHTGGYDLQTGRELWRMSGGGDIPVPTPVSGHGLIYLTSAHGDQSPVHAVRTTATGDISLKGDETRNAHVAWSVPRAGAYMATPLLYGDYLYVVRWNGILGVYDAKTGTRMYQQRLGQAASAFTASPVASGGHVYITSEDGDVLVLKAGPTYEVVATNRLDGATLATPAISEGMLYFRTQNEILAFGAPAGQAGAKVWTQEEMFRRNVGTREDQRTPFPPHKVIGNIYYVGTRSLASFLVTTPEGHILINTNYEEAVPGLKGSVEKLGFKFEDIKIVLGSHAHGDHMEGDALVKQMTGAQVMAMAEDVPALERMRPGGKPHPIDRILRDGDRVTLGGSTLVARLTPGHTKGCTTWTMDVREDGRSYSVVIIGSMGSNPGFQFVNNPNNPGIADEYKQGFRVLRSLKPDVPLASHPAMYGMVEKFGRIGKGPNPFLDPAGYTAELDAVEGLFLRVLAEQQRAAGK